MKRSTKAGVIAKARAVHGNKYDYSKVDYQRWNIKVCIICPEHGEFWQRPNDHLQGQGCPSCGRESCDKSRADARRNKRPDLSHIETPEGSKAVPVGTKGDYALVDEEDYERVVEYNWHLTTGGYANNDSVGRMHRFIINTPDGMSTDHKNRSRLDNRKGNLRICSLQENNYNRAPTAGSSIFKGVSWHKASNKWSAYINYHQGRVYLGLYKTEEEAARAYDEAAKKYHKDFARLNFPNNDVR